MMPAPPDTSVISSVRAPKNTPPGTGKPPTEHSEATHDGSGASYLTQKLSLRRKRYCATRCITRWPLYINRYTENNIVRLCPDSSYSLEIARMPEGVREEGMIDPHPWRGEMEHGRGVGVKKGWYCSRVRNKKEW